MFRIDVSHLQAPTILLPDALFTLGSHSVYMWITYLLKLFEYRVALYGESVIYLVPVFGYSKQ